MEMEHFREDNTEGYNADQLAELNRRFDAEMDKLEMNELDDESLIDNIAEHILADFDAEECK